jgi:hypothetical protein
LSICKDASKKTDDAAAFAGQAPCGLYYPLHTVALAIRLVVYGLTSLRGSCRVAGVFSHWFKNDFPSHVAVQNWLMRLGLHKLTKPLERRTDWIYILDYTIDFGAKKCLVLLGITMESFRNCDCRPSHRDMEVLSVEIHCNACATSVLEALRTASRRTGGNPTQIVSDHGSDIKKGVELFIENNPEIKYTYDITHKAALLLKHHLKDDSNWQRLVKQTGATKRAVVHTKLAFAAPPKPRDKARWLNLDSYLNWAEKMLAFADRKEESLLDESDADAVDWEKFEEKFGWLREFRPHLREWRTMLDLLQAAKDEIKRNGLRLKSAKQFEKAIAGTQLDTERLRCLKKQLLMHIQTESALTATAQKDHRWLGSSDIIESMFGKYKNFSARTPMKEVGKSVLSMPVFTSDVTLSEVKEAMENVSMRDLREWLTENVGDTLLAKRKRAFNYLETKKPVKKKVLKLPKAAGF